MGAEATTPCANCARLQAQVDALTATVARLEAALAQVQAQLASARKDSSTSSKPPSSDIVKPPKPQPPTGQDKRQGGGQPGHPKHQRLAFPPEALTAPPSTHRLPSPPEPPPPPPTSSSPPEVCPDCGLGLRPAGDAPRIIQH